MAYHLFYLLTESLLCARQGAGHGGQQAEEAEALTHARFSREGSKTDPEHHVQEGSGSPVFPKERGVCGRKTGRPGSHLHTEEAVWTSGHGSSCQDFREADSAFRVAPSASQRATWELKP